MIVYYLFGHNVLEIKPKAARKVCFLNGLFGKMVKMVMISETEILNYIKWWNYEKNIEMAKKEIFLGDPGQNIYTSGLRHRAVYRGEQNKLYRVSSSPLPLPDKSMMVHG